ncbi:MAG: hypothetical protein JNL11_11825 [Bdellovibrionaceae bacterium]|nr:hypothetical protein [Pseudobdellovibrionaceae bacterium]
MSGYELLKRYATIFSFISVVFATKANALHQFGLIADIEARSKESRMSYQNFITFEQNWSSGSSKFVGQLRIFEYYKRMEEADYFIHEIFPAEFIFETNFSSQRLTIGYQNIFLSEGFNLIDTEVFHAKNNEVSIFNSTEKLYYTTPGLNYKYFGENISLQLGVFKAERFERLSYYQKKMVLNMTPGLIEPDYRNSSNDVDQLAKLIGTVGAVDWSLYTSKTQEKRPTFQLDLTRNQVVRVANPFRSYGVGFSSLLGSAVLRLDYQKNIERTFLNGVNQIVNSDQDNYNFGIEQTFGANTRVNLIYGSSKLREKLDLPMREDEMNDVFLNVNYKINDRISVDVSAFDRIATQTNGQHISMNSKIRENIEVKYGFESLWTGIKSKVPFLNEEDRVFVNVKGTVF